MKTTTHFLLSGLLAALFCATGNAQVIYSNSFTGGAVTISGTAPTVANTLLGGTNSAHWIFTYTNGLDGGWLADGAIGTNAGSVLLPFKPQSGAIYYLTASINMTAANNWLGLGFAQTATQGTNAGAERFTDANVKGGPWMYAEVGAKVDFFGGPETALPVPSADVEPTAGTYTLTIILNTLGSKWTTSAYANGVIQGTNVVGGMQLGTNIVYGANPTIGYVGLTQQAITTGSLQWNYLALSTALAPVISQQPASSSVSAGANYTNSVSAQADTNGGPLLYQWYDNNVPISKATNATLPFTPVSISNGGTNYYVVVSNTYGAVTSAVASLTVYTNPVITAQLPITYVNPFILYGGQTVDGTNYVGSTPTFSISVLGGLPLRYQWLANGVAMTGATNANLTFTNCQMSGPTNFACVVANSFGTNTSAPWLVSYIPTPTVSYPQAVLAAQPVSYWRLNEQPDNGNGNDGTIADDYEGGNNGIYNNVTLGQQGYSPTTDPTDTSTAFGLGSTFSYAGQIQGVDFAAPTGSNAEFTVEGWANGFSPNGGAPIITKGIYGVSDAFLLGVDTNSQRNYQFYVRSANGTVYTADATNATANGTDGNWHLLVGVCDEANGLVSLYIDGKLSATASIPSNAGDYEASAPVSIGAGTPSAAAGYTIQFYGFMNDVATYSYAINSAQVALQFSSVGGVAPAFVQTPPTSVTNNAGTSLTLPATLIGTAPMGYYWTDVVNGTNVAAGATNSIQLNATLTVASVPAGWNGDQLELTVTNAYGATNFYVNLHVASGLPQIVTDVQTPFYVGIGGTASNSVTVDGSSPFYYQWQFNGANLTDNGQITGSQTSVLRIANAQAANAGSYQVIISNSFGPISSSVAALTVLGIPPVGFGSSGPGWQTNQMGAYTTPLITNGLLTLTDGHGDEARAFFFEYPQYIGAFKATFTYLATGTADGAAFCLQNDPRGASAIGAIGGGLGVGTGSGGSIITPSVELELNIYSGNGLGGTGYSFDTNGTIGSTTSPGFSVIGDPINVSISYATGKMAVTFSNQTTAAVFNTNVTVGDLTQVLSNNTAYVGFTGSTGGATSVQTVTNFSFVSIPTAALQVSGGEAFVTWLGVIPGYTLQETANLGTPNWVNVTNQAYLTNGVYQTTVPVNGSAEFYRLILQP